jgi:formamidopyrimidine-DNA glycosylase
MPELPEVENLRIGLEREIKGQKILSAEVRLPKIVSGTGNRRKASRTKTAEFIKGVGGKKITAIDRRAKNLIFKLLDGSAILVHLKMSGQFIYKPSKKGNSVEGGHPIELSRSELPNKHTHIIFKLEKGDLFYNDTRTFGYLIYYKNLDLLNNSETLKNIGPEPLSDEFTLKYFEAALKARKKNLKSALLSQEIVVGLGNIYVDEVCFHAGINPSRITNKLKSEEIKKLYGAIKNILPRAIELGGSSVATYMLLDESRGNFAREHKVYGKSGDPCARCKRPLVGVTLAGRSTVFCKNCQR